MGRIPVRRQNILQGLLEDVYRISFLGPKMSKENDSSVDDFRMSTGYPFQVQRMSKGDEDILWLSIGCPQVVLWRGRPKVVIKTFTLYMKWTSFKDVLRTREGLKSAYP